MFYGVCVFLAGYYSYNGPASKMPPFLIEAVTLIGGALAMNFGATLGIEGKEFNDGLLATNALTLGQQIRLLGAAFYFASLLLAVWWWWMCGWTKDSDQIVRTIPEQSRMFLGILAGAIVLVFSWM